MSQGDVCGAEGVASDIGAVGEANAPPCDSFKAASRVCISAVGSSGSCGPPGAGPLVAGATWPEPVSADPPASGVGVGEPNGTGGIVAMVSGLGSGIAGVAIGVLVVGCVPPGTLPQASSVTADMALRKHVAS